MMEYSKSFSVNVMGFFTCEGGILAIWSNMILLAGGGKRVAGNIRKKSGEDGDSIREGGG